MNNSGILVFNWICSSTNRFDGLGKTVEDWGSKRHFISRLDFQE
jgi:hypothetical protein